MVKKIQVAFSDELFEKVDELRVGQFMSPEEFAIDAVRHQILAGTRKEPVKKRLVLEDLYSRPPAAPVIDKKVVGK